MENLLNLPIELQKLIGTMALLIHGLVFGAYGEAR